MTMSWDTPATDKDVTLANKRSSAGTGHRTASSAVWSGAYTCPLTTSCGDSSEGSSVDCAKTENALLNVSFCPGFVDLPHVYFSLYGKPAI